jgi:hypothetical protein
MHRLFPRAESRVRDRAAYPVGVGRGDSVNGSVESEWGVSDTNRKVRIYKLTAAGKKRLADERRTFDAMILAIGRVLEA